MNNKKLKILVACEESQAVTIELRKLGHDAYSNDLIECSGGHPEWHIQKSTLDIMNDGWDMIIAFPPCTYLSNSGARWMYNSKDDSDLLPWDRKPHVKHPHRRHLQAIGAEFFMAIAKANCPRIAIENPMNVMGSIYRHKDQVIQPYEYGDAHKKTTWLWLKGLPGLIPTDIVEPNLREYTGKTGKKTTFSVDYMENKRSKTGDSSSLRSKTYPGIAKAMAEQWAGKVN